MVAELTVLVVGATGATGRHVVRKLLNQGHRVKVIVRSKERMMAALESSAEEEVKDKAGTKPEEVRSGKLVATEKSLLDLSDDEMKEQAKDSSFVVSCLGHNPTIEGLFGEPRELVTDATKRLTTAMMETKDSAKSSSKCKFILMGSDGVAHPNDDQRSFMDRCILAVIRYLLPAHRDNESAADFLINGLGTEKGVEWCAVRPTDLVDGPTTEYKLHPKSIGSLFGAGTARRANVAQAMVDLMTKEDTWNEWKFKMPVLHDDKDKTQSSTG